MPPKSGHLRAKNIDYEDDDIYSDEEEYYEEGGDGADGMTNEDKEQMRLGTAKVKEALGSSFSVTDAEIQEALWHYYYDVAKSVSYLKNKFTPKTQTPSKAKPVSKFDQAIGAAGKTPTGKQDVKHTQESTSVVRCADQEVGSSTIQSRGLPVPCSTEHISANNFFWDTPWGNVPQHRLGVITAVPTGLKGGLLGGSSKLAALAAKRKQKQEAAAKTGNTPVEADKAVALLDRLSVKETGPSIHGEREARKTLSRYPKKRSPSPPPVHVKEEEPTLEPIKPAIEFPNLRAKPSMFASTLCATEPPQKRQKVEASTKFPLPYSTLPAFQQADPFAGPSPDDIVRAAQARAAGRGTPKPKSTPKKTNGDKVAESVEKLTVDEAPKVKSKNLNVVEEFEKSGMKRISSFVVIGHVDHGKSTLMGRLLYDLKVVDKRSVDKLRKEAETIGKSSFALAWVMDQTDEERSRGVTVDIATESFQTEKTSFTILDAPGHRDFVPRMISGASQADFALLVIDANANSFESGLKGQTREHIHVIRSTNVRWIVVAVNKMDSLSWSQSAFDRVSRETTVLFTSANFLAKNITFVPCAGLTGGNVTKRIDDSRADWYKGGTLLEALESIDPPKRDIEGSLRFTIGDVFRGGITNPISVSGRIEAGSLQVGDVTVVRPSNETATIKGIEVNNEPADWAIAGQFPTLHLVNVDPVHLHQGDVLCNPRKPVRLVKNFTCRVLAFDHILPGTLEVFKSHRGAVAKITRLCSTMDLFTGDTLKKKVRIVQPGEVARIVVELESELPLEKGDRVVFRSGKTVAAGLLES